MGIFDDHMTVLTHYRGPGLLWIRLWSSGPGLCLTRQPLNFSERHGLKRYWNVPFGWRIQYIEPG